MKYTIGAAIALAGAAAYGGSLYHGLDQRVTSLAEKQQSRIASADSLLVSIAQRDDALNNQLAAHGQVVRDAVVISGRFDRLDPDHASASRDFTGYQQGLRTTRALLDDYFSEITRWQHLGSSLADEANRSFQQMITELYQRTQERISAAHESVRRQNPQSHIRDAMVKVFFEALGRREADTIYTLHLGNPPEASPQSYKDAMVQFETLCDTVNREMANLSPKGPYHYEESKWGHRGLDEETGQPTSYTSHYYIFSKGDRSRKISLRFVYIPFSDDRGRFESVKYDGVIQEPRSREPQ